jgi:hypothetical protein
VCARAYVQLGGVIASLPSSVSELFVLTGNDVRESPVFRQYIAHCTPVRAQRAPHAFVDDSIFPGQHVVLLNGTAVSDEERAAGASLHLLHELGNPREVVPREARVRDALACVCAFLAFVARAAAGARRRPAAQLLPAAPLQTQRRRTHAAARSLQCGPAFCRPLSR